MGIKSYNKKSFSDAGITFREALEVEADPFAIEIPQTDSHKGNPRVLYVGRTLTERLLEVGVEFMDGMDYCYHAEVATKVHKKLYGSQGV